MYPYKVWGDDTFHTPSEQYAVEITARDAEHAAETYAHGSHATASGETPTTVWVRCASGILWTYDISEETVRTITATPVARNGLTA